VEQLCDRVVLMDRGEIVAQGEPSDVVAEYHRRVLVSEVETHPAERPAVHGVVTLTNVTLRDPKPASGSGFRTGDPLVVSLRYATEGEARVVFELSYYSIDGRTLLATTCTDTPGGCHVSPPGGTVEFTCAAIPFRPGSYYVSAVVREASTRHAIGWWDGGTTLYVEPGATSAGQFYMPHTWTIKTPNS
jgi:hypothetical protein